MTSTTSTTFTLYTVTVHLGGIELACTTTANAVAEIHPEVFFVALQRIGANHDATQAEHLEHDLRLIQQTVRDSTVGGLLSLLRAQMEHRQAPSMSTGDRVVIDTPTLTLTHHCQRIGWQSEIHHKERS